MQMKTASECWLEAEDNLNKIDISKICSFGISVLDDALVGIFPNDFITIGADSGAGKSELALDIAMHNAKIGKKVALYFIEGGAEEAINRIRWKLIKNRYYSMPHKTTIDMDYRKWRMGMLRGDLLSKLNMDSFLEFNATVKDNLNIYCFEEGFTVDMLINSLGWFKKNKNGEFLMENYLDIDLLIIDHLQYFTLDNPKNELTEMTQILMKVKNITNFHNIPVLLISHLRKKDKDRGLPNQEDFFGTSNISKVSSQAITITPYFQTEDYQNNIYPTFFRFVKSRTGIRSSIAALCSFDAVKGIYDSNYSIYKLTSDKPNADALDRFKLPKWAYEALLKKEKGGYKNE